MVKLTRYSNFKDLKSDTGPHQKPEMDSNLAMREFEEFINLVRNKKLTADKTTEAKSADGKQDYR